MATEVRVLESIERRRPETMWKLVDAKCVQLADAVGAARVPFLLSVLWGFVWAVAIYNHDFGYLNTVVQRYEQLLVDVRGKEAEACRKLIESPLQRYHLHDFASADPKVCMKAIEDSYKHVLEQQIDQWSLNLPGLVARVTVFDLSIVGQFGLLLLLVWFFYAARRENHAIRSFVDIKDVLQLDRWIPSKFTLKPMERALSAEHYAYAYQAVSQRFLFILSTKSQPLLATTVVLVAFPSLVAAYNVYTDVRDIIYLFQHRVALEQLGRLMIEWVLFAGIFLCTKESIKLAMQSSVILNAWYLANVVWEDHWDETNLDPTPSILIDRDAQRATLAETQVGAASGRLAIG